MKLPNFSDLRPDVDIRLNDILHRAMNRSREGRFQTAEEMLVGLENFIYGEGYGPTNEKLAAYLKDLFGADGENAALRWDRGRNADVRHLVIFIFDMQSQGLRQVQKQTQNLVLAPQLRQSLKILQVPALNWRLRYLGRIADQSLA